MRSTWGSATAFLALVLAWWGAVARVATAAILVDDDVRIRVWEVRSGSPSGLYATPYHVTTYRDSTLSGTEIGSGQQVQQDFLSFCVEPSEYFPASGQRFNIDDVSSESRNGYHRLTGYAAWVYDTFLKKFSLTPSSSFADLKRSGFLDKVGGRWVSDLYQEAIWAGMIADGGRVGDANSEFRISSWTLYDQIGIGYGSFLGSDWGGAAASEAERLATLGNYRVINILPHQEGGLPMGQDQLCYVPEPASLVVWTVGALVAAIAVGLRRVRRHATSPAKRSPA